MAKVNRTLMVGDDVVEVAPDNLPTAAANAKGAVKQGEGIAKDPYPSSTADNKINTVLESLRQSGVVANDKFVVFYDKNFPQGVEEGGNIPRDETVYSAGQTATVKFEDSEERVPYCQGYDFIGWALSPSAVPPSYPYDENDPQTYTITFTDNDIVLYAVWQEKTATVTYALGDYGTGSVPSAQTVHEGDEVQLSFSPAPTVNDGSGRIFVGWSETDGGNSYNDATYRQGATDTIYPYEDITLYPVFAAQYTLTYALGNDATGTVPNAQTAYNGQTLSIDFNPSVTCVSDNTKVFVGWSETDGDTTATYTANGTNSIYMNKNITLYPVFAAQGQGGSITIVNTSGKSYTVEVCQGETSILTIAAGTQEVFNYTPAEQYEIRSTLTNGTFDGVYNGTLYQNASLQYLSGAVGKFYNPSGSSSDWEFSSGDSGTLTIS